MFLVCKSCIFTLTVCLLLLLLQAMNGVELDGRPIAVRFARPGRTDAADDNSSSSQACQQPGPRTNNSRSADRSNAGESRPVQANTLYVQNLAYSILAEDLQEAFSSCQGYEDANIVVKAGKPAGYGFVRFSSEEAAAAVAEVCEGFEVLGQGTARCDEVLMQCLCRACSVKHTKQ
jgi:RNA recognition motif-containing protein